MVVDGVGEEFLLGEVIYFYDKVRSGLGSNLLRNELFWNS